MDNHLVESYIQNPIHNKTIENPTISKTQDNKLCGDAITIHLKIQNDIITNYSYTGDYTIITGAAASFLWDIIIGENIQTITKRNLKTLEEQQFIVSPRRKRSTVTALLACQNAIYQYQNKQEKKTFEDLLY